ncbi:hypothetical protein [Streptomyces sp. NPDC093105]|uniref:hypothetical protein n=1 Tax=Streptomyces sp. NPDC093105 TaxID=3366029 RepID=UPI00381B6BDA
MEPDRRSVVTVHQPSRTGGRRVTLRGGILGLAYDDWDLVELLRGAGFEDPEGLVGADSHLIEWRGGHPHQYVAA